MTKEELKAKVAKQQSVINDANNQICSDVKERRNSLWLNCYLTFFFFLVRLI